MNRVQVVLRWLKEPLLHFVVLGIALFALHRSVAPRALTNRIVLSDSVIRGLRQDYQRRTGIAPTAEEEAALIRQYVDNEVLYREAVALGLDREDVIVRRRLVQKMEFLTEGLEPIPEPSDAELQTYLDAHPERYAEVDRVTLTQVFIGSAQHGSEMESAAHAVRAQLVAGTDPAALGDPFVHGAKFTARTERELAGVFGAPFAAQVLALPPGSWSEPLRSSYGLHLVWVAERTPGHRPVLAEVQAAVRRDYQEEHRTQANRAALDRLRQRYEIRIERPAETVAAR